MIATILASAAMVAFPSECRLLPFLERVYMIGSVRKGDTNVVVQGRNVPVYRTGAWATLIDVVPGTNIVEIVTQSGVKTRKAYRVAQKPSAAGGRAKERKWKKLAFAGDTPKVHPCGKPPQSVTIVIDPGHGGRETGAVSPHGHYEKDANLKISLCIRDELVALGFRVVMTREDDRALSLSDRPKIAHECGADAFVSIHHNAPAYSSNPAGIRYHAVYAWNDIGKALARSVNSAMAGALKGELADSGVVHANFVVTRNPEIPSCLVEVDFITSPAGEEASWSAPRRRKAAKAIAEGIASWASSLDPTAGGRF